MTLGAMLVSLSSFLTSSLWSLRAGGRTGVSPEAVVIKESNHLLPGKRSALSVDLSPGQKPFKRSPRGSDALSETSSVSHIEDLEKPEHVSGAPEPDGLEPTGPEPQPGTPPPQEAERTGAFQNRAQRPEDDRPQVEEPESLR